MTLDGEWGLSMRVAETPKFPNNMALGAISRPELLYDYGREMARECKLMGLQVNFAPVIDVNSNPKNPVIGYRSFGEDPNRVAALGQYYARGLEDGGVQAVGKHFPGHGDTATDSHKEQTTVNHSLETLRNVDLVPFQSFIDNGVSGIMVGHICVPALDPSGRPASLSHKMTQELLRDQMGFEGLIYTDALGMKGASYQGKNPAIEAMKAGADVLLCSSTPAEDLKLIEKALKDKQLDPAMVEDRCKRVLRYKYALGLDRKQPTIDPEAVKGSLWTPQTRKTLDQLAAGCITVLRNEDATLPIGLLGKKSIAVVNIGAEADNNFAKICRKYAKTDVYATGVDGSLSASQLQAIKAHDIVIAAVYIDDQAAKTAFGKLADANELIGVFMVNPYKMSKFHTALPSCDAVVLAYDDLPETRAAAAMALFGGIEVSGTLPVNLPGVAPMGTGVRIPKSRLGYSTPLAEGMRPSLTDSLDSIVGRALADGAFPGAQLLVARNGNVVYDKSFGQITKGGADVDEFTVYDLASVSKATGTLPGVMKAYDLGLFELDAPAADYIPGLKEAGKTFTPRDLLYHETGMPAAINAYTLMMDTTTFTGQLFTAKKDKNHGIYLMRNAWGNNTAKIRRDITSPVKTEQFNIPAAEGLWVGQATIDTVLNVIYNQPLRDDKSYNYSCLNFILLLDMEQRLTGQSHDKWVNDSVFAPMGAYSVGYRAALHHPLDKIAPTENDTFMRRQTVHGYVHDETAAIQGGVSGNAGLFSNAADLAKLCQTWLNGGTYGDARIFSPETTELFTTAKSPTCRRGLGFDKPDVENPAWSPTCDEAGAGVYGHLGFTGTVFWVDPDEALIFIFLNNRVNPTRDNAAFNRANVRPELFRQVYKSLER